ncbi:hypothetical protein ACWJIJ_12490 [Morganella morganii]
MAAFPETLVYRKNFSRKEIILISVRLLKCRELTPASVPVRNSDPFCTDGNSALPDHPDYLCAYNAHDDAHAGDYVLYRVPDPHKTLPERLKVRSLTALRYIPV